MGSDGGQVREEVDSIMSLQSSKPHVVIITVPAPGHIFPSIALGKALARQGVKVTLLSSGCVPEKLRRDVELGEEELDMTLGTVLEDPLQEPEHPMALIPWLSKLPREEMVEHAYNIIQKLSPPPCCFISDTFISWTKMLEEKLGIPRHFLVTMSASSLLFMFAVSPTLGYSSN